MTFPWKWQAWAVLWGTRGLGLQCFVSHKKTACFMHSVSVVMAQHLSTCCSIVVLAGFVPVGISAAQCCLFQEVLLVLPNSAVAMIYELCSCERWLVALLLVVLPASRARRSKNLWNSSCFIWRDNGCVVWPGHERHGSCKAQCGASRWDRKSYFLHLWGHSESLKGPHVLRADYTSVDFLYCRLVV